VPNYLFGTHPYLDEYSKKNQVPLIGALGGPETLYRERTDLAKEKQLRNCTCHNLRYYPMVQQMRGMREDGDLGEILVVQGTYSQDWLLYDTDWNWRIESSANGPSRVMDFSKTDGASNLAYAPPGYVLYVTGGTLMAQPFEAKKLALTVRVRTIRVGRSKP
jgi:hypothetical protein